MTGTGPSESTEEARALSQDNTSVSVTPAIDTPTRTVSDPGGNEFTLSSSGRVDFGGTFDVSVTAPSDLTYDVKVRTENNVWAFVPDKTGDTTVTMDTTDMPNASTDETIEVEPGSYIAGISTDDDNFDEFTAIEPLVVQAYDVTADPQPLVMQGGELDVAADLSPISAYDGTKSFEEIEVIYWKDGGGGTRETVGTDGLSHEGTITGFPNEDFNVQVAATRTIDDGDDVDTEAVGVSDSNRVEVVDDTLSRTGVRDIGGQMQFSTVAADGQRVFIGGLRSTVAAVPKTAMLDETAWAYDRAGSLSDSSPTVNNGTVYLGSGGGVVYALDAGTDDATGSVDWTYPDTEEAGDSAITSSPVVSGQTVYVGANDGTVRALDTATGTLKWTVDAGGPVYSRPAVGNQHVFVTTAGGTLVAIDTASESVAWTDDTGTPFGSAGPAVDSGTVYVAADDISAFDSTGTSLWTASAYGGTAGGTPVVDNGVLYVGSADGQVYALDAGTGSSKWTGDVGGAVAATPASVDGRILVSSLAGDVAFLDSEYGIQRATETLPGASRSKPVVDGSTVYVGFDDGYTGKVAVLDINRL